MSQDTSKSVEKAGSTRPGPVDDDDWGDTSGMARTTGLKLVAPTAARAGTAETPTLTADELAALVPANSESAQVFDSRPPPPPEVDPYLGCTIDNRYKVEAILGEGGMGVVYQCRHKIIDKKVAMKILRADLAREKEVTERFLIEAKAASAIGNEHIIDISDFGQLPDGSAYFVMEFLEGKPLSAQVEGGQPMPVPRIIHVALQLAKGLDAAHSAGIVHRDLKPDNIFIVNRGADPNFVKILDFGIAKVSSGKTGKLTQAGSVFGTPHYMSPEQAAGAPVDHRGDIYAIGVILYELASAKVPFDADNFMGILTQHMYKAPIPIRTLVPVPQEVPPGFEAIILKCLSKRPEQRYQSMQELAADLERFKAGEVPVAVREMMDRSGGFNVPADFFKRSYLSDAPAASSHRIPEGRRGLLFLGVAALAIFAFGVLAMRTLGNVAEPALQAEPVAVEAVAAPAAVEIKTTDVLLAVDPLAAHVFQGDKDLGTSPVMVEVPQGSEVEVEVRHPNFKTQSLTLNGSTTKLSIKLEPVQKAAPAPVNRTPRSPIPSSDPANKARKNKGNSGIGGGEIVNPWAG